MSIFKVLATIAAVISLSQVTLAKNSPAVDQPTNDELISASASTIFDHYLSLIKSSPSIEADGSVKFQKNKPTLFKIKNFAISVPLQGVTIPLGTPDVQGPNANESDFNVVIHSDCLILVVNGKTLKGVGKKSYQTATFNFLKGNQNVPLVLDIRSKDIKLISLHLQSITGTVRGLDDDTAPTIQASANCAIQQELLDLTTSTFSLVNAGCSATFNYPKADGNYSGEFKYDSYTPALNSDVVRR